MINRHLGLVNEDEQTMALKFVIESLFNIKMSTLLSVVRRINNRFFNWAPYAQLRSNDPNLGTLAPVEICF